MPDVGTGASGRSWRAPALVGLGLAALAATSAAAGEPAALAGRWRGPVAEGAAPGSAREVVVEVEPAAGGAVAVRWTTLDGGEAEALLEPSSRPGVLGPAAAGGGIKAMLGGSAAGRRPNPLEGRPLLWGRRDGRGLYLYRLEIARDGRLALDRYALEPGPAEGGDGTAAFAAGRVGPGGEAVAGLRATLRREGR